MNDVIYMTGRLLFFDKPGKTKVIFDRNCEFSIPEKVPVTWEFNYYDQTKVLGIATNFRKDDLGYICDVELNNFDRNILHNTFQDELPIGGYYTNVRSNHNYEDGTRIINRANLQCIGVTLGPADDDLKLVLKETRELQSPL